MPHIEALVVDLQIAQEPLHQRGLIARIQDGEFRRHAQVRVLLAHHPHPERVEGTHRHRARRLAGQLVHALLHLVRGFVGEGDGQDGLGRNSSGNQVRDPVRDHPRLPRPGARQHQQRPIAVEHRRALLRVQMRQIHPRSVARMRAAKQT